MAGDTPLTIVGSVGNDPELRFSPAGKPTASFSVGSTPRRFDRQANEWKDGATLWTRVVVFGDMAEHLAESIERGARVVVTGRLVGNEWTDKEGQKRYSTELIADEVGPSLRYATAKVAKTSRGSGGGFGGSQERQGAGGGSQQADPWSAQAPEEPPF